MKTARHGSGGVFELPWILFFCTCRFAVAVRDTHVDTAILEDPVVDLPQLDDAADDASYMDCLRRWADERQRQLAFSQGYGHLLAAQHKVQRLHLSLRSSEPIRNVTLLVSALQHRLGWLLDASSRYGARLKDYVDELHPRLRERCKNSTLRTDDLSTEVVTEASSRRRAATLNSLRLDIGHTIADHEPGGVSRPGLVEQTPTTTSVSQPDVVGQAFARTVSQPDLVGQAFASTTVSQPALVPAFTDTTVSQPDLVGQAFASTTVSQPALLRPGFTDTTVSQPALVPAFTDTTVSQPDLVGQAFASTTVSQPALLRPGFTDTTVSQPDLVGQAFASTTVSQPVLAGQAFTSTTVSQPDLVGQAFASTTVSQPDLVGQAVTSTTVSQPVLVGQAFISTTENRPTDLVMQVPATTTAFALAVTTPAVNQTVNETVSCSINDTACFDTAMLINVEPTDTKELFLNGSGASVLPDHQKESYLYGKKDLQQCRELAQNFSKTFPSGTAVRKVSNNPLKITLPCVFNPESTLLCDRWLLDDYDKVKLQTAWIAALALALAAFAGSTLLGRQIRKVFGRESPEASELSKDDISRFEMEALVHNICGDRAAHLAKVFVMVLNVFTVVLPISNVAIFALATEKTYFPSHDGVGFSDWCANWHDTWLIGSICLLLLLQVARAAASSKSPRFSGSGHFAWLVYLLTDVSSVADTVAVGLSCCSFLYCRAVHWNWMIFTFVRVIESLGHWGIGVNFHGFSQAGNGREDRRMVIAMSSFGLVMWVLIGSLYYAVNMRNAASRWETAVTVENAARKPRVELELWQRFESIPSSMFFALLNLYKKNPMALAFDNWHEQMLVVFVNVWCVPIFALVAGMIGSAVSNAVCAKDPNDRKQDQEAQSGLGAHEDEYEEEEEEEEEQEEDPLVEGFDDEKATKTSVLEQWKYIIHSWREFLLNLTWEDHLHPAVLAILGFGSLFFYGITTSCQDAACTWFFVRLSRFPSWAHPVADGAVGAAFLADWITSSAVVARRADSEDAASSADGEMPAADSGDGVAADQISFWRHIGYFIASVPGIVHLLLLVANGFEEPSENKYIFCLCSLFRIYLLEKWLDHPFRHALEAIEKHRKALATTGAVSIFFWFLGAHLLFFSEFRNPDRDMTNNYGSLMRSIWASSIFLNGEWVFCDFTWAGKAVGCFVVIFGVSIVVVPMMVFSGEFMKRLLGDFFENNVHHLKAEELDLWQLKMEPAEDAPSWRKEVFSLLYAHLQRLKQGLHQETQFHRSRILRQNLPWRFQLFKQVSLSTSLIFTLVTLMENSQYMNAKVGCTEKEIHRNIVFRQMFDGVEQCRSFLTWADTIEARIDLVFLHFFILEFILRYIALGWRHFFSELGLAELFAIVGLSWSLTRYREDALHHPENWRASGTMIGAVVPLRLCRLVSVGSYFGVVRAVRKVLFIARWPLIKSFYFLLVVWYTHAMLLHFAESDSTSLAIAGAQVRPAKDPDIPDGEVLFLKPMEQSKRFKDYLTAMQYSLLHLTGDYPIVKYTITSKLLLIAGLVVGTCAVVVWTAIFSSSMVNYLANEAVEDPLAKAVERRMLLAIEVVTRIQRSWRRRQAERKKAREQAGMSDEKASRGSQHPGRPPPDQDKALRRFWASFPWERFFQITLVVNLCVNMLCSLPEVVPLLTGRDSWEELYRQRLAAKFETLCLVIFCVELVLTLRAGKGREGKRWYFYRTVDFLCLLPGVATITMVTVEFIKKDHAEHTELAVFLVEVDMLVKATKMVRVLRILFWRQWKDDVQVFIRGVTSTGPILAVPVFMSLQIWVVISSLFVFTENTWNSPSQAFFASVPSAMYWTSSFLIGEWTLADFSPGAGSRVCICTALFGIMGFAIPMGILMEGVKQSMVVDMMERLPLNELAEYEEAKGTSKRPSQQAIKAQGTDASSSRIDTGGIDRHQQLKRAAKLAAMTRLQASKTSKGQAK